MRSRRVGARGVLLLLALISSFPLAARAQTPVQADKTNRCDITKYANSAISGHSLGQVSYSGGNLDACYEACRNNAACVAVVDNRHASPPYCSLKSMLEPYGNTAKDVYSVPTIKSCCRLTSITAGGQGNCALWMASGGSCSPNCNDGYTLNGDWTCNNGALTTATCEPSPCDEAALPITNGAASPCPSTMTSGDECFPTCDAGYTLSGSRSCLRGTLTDTTECQADPCTASSTPGKDGSDGQVYCINGGTIGGTTGSCTCTCPYGYEGTGCEIESPCDEAALPITNGAASPCPSTMTSGDECFPTCDAGYTLSGSRSCLRGTLTDTTECQADPCTASSTPGDDGSDGTFYCVNGGTIGGTTGSCTCTDCNPGYESTSCQMASACTANPLDSTKDGSDGSIHCGEHGSVDGVTGSCTCTCDLGWEGNGCETAGACSASDDSAKDGGDGIFYCINGGTVGGITDACTCTSCDTAYGGASCHVGPCDMEKACYDFNVRNGMTTPEKCAWMAYEAPGCEAK